MKEVDERGAFKFAIASCSLFPRGYLRQGLVYDPGRFASGQLVDRRSINGR